MSGDSSTGTPARRFTDAAENPTTVIGAGMQVKGVLSGEGALDLAGALEGPCRISGHCRVREGGRLSGDVTAGSVVVEGEITGHQVIAQRVEIGAGGRVRANIRAAVVAIAEGAFFEGDVNMDGTDGAAAPTSFKEKRRRRE
jgi:cytoskeletal protein CcmA (bactofilin family)